MLKHVRNIFHTFPTSKTTAARSFFLLHAAALDAACGTSQGTFKVEPIILERSV